MCCLCCLCVCSWNGFPPSPRAFINWPSHCLCLVVCCLASPVLCALQCVSGLCLRYIAWLFFGEREGRTRVTFTVLLVNNIRLKVVVVVVLVVLVPLTLGWGWVHHLITTNGGQCLLCCVEGRPPHCPHFIGVRREEIRSREENRKNESESKLIDERRC